jgi:hypothetical protein
LDPTLHVAFTGIALLGKNAACPADFAHHPLYGFGLTALSLAWAASGNLLAVSNIFSYFVGGWRNKWRYVVRSNAVWDQNHIYLEKSIKSHLDVEGTPVAHCGGSEPTDVELACTPMTIEQATQLLAIPHWSDISESCSCYAFDPVPRDGLWHDPSPLSARLAVVKAFSRVVDPLTI